MNREFRKYIWYAVGEILLIVVGIIIALQINTWAANKKTQQRLSSYLANIALSIEDDIVRLEQLKAIRIRTKFDSHSTLVATLNPETSKTAWYGPAAAASFNASLEKVQKKHYLVANSGNYRALESSGLISELSDTQLGPLLYNYYRSVERIAVAEQDINNAIRELSLRFLTETGQDIPSYFRNEPLLIWNGDVQYDADVIETFKQSYWEMLSDPITRALLQSAAGQPLLQEYEHVLSTGRQLVYKIRSSFGGTLTQQSAAKIYDPTSPLGHPIIMEHGLPQYHAYGVFVAPSPNSGLDTVYDGIWIDDNALHARYIGGEPWVYLYLRLGPIDQLVEKPIGDYSKYANIQLEAKRASETQCSQLRMEIKDIDDAARGGLRSVPLALTPDWQTYTIDLAEFVEADLTRLSVVAGFLFDGEEPCTIAIRDIRYLAQG